MLKILLLCFFSIFIVISFYVDRLSLISRRQIFAVAFLGIAIICASYPAALRLDATAYIEAFLYSPSSLSDFGFDNLSNGLSKYSEKGFFLLTSVIHFFTESPDVYYFMITILSFAIIYWGVTRHGIYPMTALCIYLARFMAGRNFAQVRSALAIPILILGVKYITERKLYKFLIIIFISYHLHHSALIFLPLYFLPQFKLRKIHIVGATLVAFLFALVAGDIIYDVLSHIDFVQDMAGDYVDKESGSVWLYDAGLTNPMIYFQIIVLFWFTFEEKYLRRVSPHYYVMRDGYFISTLLLIMLTQFGTLAGRLSTIMATFEMFMLPMFLNIYTRRSRTFIYVFIFFVCVIFFSKNISSFI